MAQTAKRSPRRTPPPPKHDDDQDDMHTVYDRDSEDLVCFIRDRVSDARRVSIRSMGTEGRWVMRGSMPMDAFSEDAVQQRYKGGVYQFGFHRADGTLAKTITNIEIADPIEEEPTRPAAVVATPAAASVSVVEMLQAELARNNALLLEMVRARQTVQPQSNITELVTALVQLRSLEPKHERQPEVQELVMKSFEHGLALAQKIGRPESGGPLSDLLGFAREIFQDARPLIQSALLKQMPQPNPPQTVEAGTTVSAAPGGEPVQDELEENLEPALAFVKDQLRAGFPPQSLADVVLMQMRANEELNQTVSALVTEQPIDMFIEIDPDLGVEPLKAQFGEFLEVMRARILAVRNIGRSSGDTANA